MPATGYIHILEYKLQITLIWREGTRTTVQSKTCTLSILPSSNKNFPRWNFNGHDAHNGNINNSEYYLVPAAMFLETIISCLRNSSIAIFFWSKLKLWSINLLKSYQSKTKKQYVVHFNQTSSMSSNLYARLNFGYCTASNFHQRFNDVICHI